jgi:hypothetical protein
MELDFSKLTENQIKIAEKAQGLALVDLSEKNSELVSEHLSLLFQILEMSEVFWDEDDNDEDEPVDKPDPVPEDSKRF